MYLSSHQMAQKAGLLGVDMRGGKPCPPGCTCKRHAKCPPGCTCKKHDAIYHPGGKPCPPGCTCKKHTSRAGSAKKCEPGCTCWLHSPERRERLRQLATEQGKREGHEKRSAQVAAVWEKRTKEERDTISRKAIASGRKTRHSPERRRISAQKMRDRWEAMTQEQKDASIKRLLTGRGKKATEIEIAVAAVLDILSISYEFEFSLDRFVVDFYIPSLNTVVEADGEYWHRSPETQAKDQERDARLAYLGYRVVRLSEQAIKEDALKAVVHGLLWGNTRGV